MNTRLFAFALAAFLFTSGVASAELLDGTSWKVQAVPTRQTATKGTERFDDVLTFSRGRLSSRELKRRGVAPVAYTSKGTADFLNWETAPLLRGKTKAEWEGVVKEQDIKGTLKWITRDGRVLYYYVNGQRR